MPRLKFVYSLLFIIACIIILVFYSVVGSPVSFSGEKVFSIARGEKVNLIAKRLEKEKLIPSSLVFQFYIKMINKDKDIKAGIYNFSSPLSIKKIVTLITDNHSSQKVFLVKAGDTLNDIQQHLREEKIVSSSSSLEKWQIKDFSSDPLYHPFFQGAPLTASLEGYLFPDSYHFSPGLSEKEIINIFLKNFASHLSSIYLSSSASSHNFYEVLTMASLLEKEVRSPKDKAMVADILWRRLKEGIPLQVDAALCYAQNKSFRNCRLTKQSFQIDSPYNLYRHRGLPPTPIDNPGLESIKAALHPQANDYWYYLTDRKTGKTIFSRTFEEHKAARRKYL